MGAKGSWEFSIERGIIGKWPKDEKGELVPPAFLELIGGSPIDLGMERRMLEAYGIATVCRYPNDGELGKVVLGSAGGGAEIFVPETLLEDAKNIISSGPSEEFPEEINEEEE
ncbi:MAG: hypothetical protein ACI3VB_05910 [Oscillospiraceae bacterium]